MDRQGDTVVDKELEEEIDDLDLQGCDTEEDWEEKDDKFRETKVKAVFRL